MKSCLRAAFQSDLPYIFELESRYRAERLLTGNSPEEHRLQFASPDCRYYVVQAGDGSPGGFVILRGLTRRNRSVELQRIAVEHPSEGLGRRALRAALNICFDDLVAHRVWLEVYPENDRARRLYVSEGFIEEGLLRDSVLWEETGEYRSKVLMSILEGEYSIQHENHAR